MNVTFAVPTNYSHVHIHHAAPPDQRNFRRLDLIVREPPGKLVLKIIKP